MNDREFIELLNLYVDHEISPQDALRLEAEVMSRPDRREIYNQYCKMQKACSMLSEQFGDVPSAPRHVLKPAPSFWGITPAMAGIAAACILVVVGLRLAGFHPRGGAGHAADQAAPRALAVSPSPSGQAEPMQPVFLTRLPASQAARNQASVFVSYDPLRQAPQLDWIDAVVLSPVVTAPSPDVHLAPRTDLRATILSDAQSVRDAQQAGEMAAFRFQR